MSSSSKTWTSSLGSTSELLQYRSINQGYQTPWSSSYPWRDFPENYNTTTQTYFWKTGVTYSDSTKKTIRTVWSTRVTPATGCAITGITLRLMIKPESTTGSHPITVRLFNQDPTESLTPNTVINNDTPGYIGVCSKELNKGTYYDEEFSFSNLMITEPTTVYFWFEDTKYWSSVSEAVSELTSSAYPGYPEVVLTDMAMTSVVTVLAGDNVVSVSGGGTFNPYTEITLSAVLPESTTQFNYTFGGWYLGGLLQSTDQTWEFAVPPGTLEYTAVGVANLQRYSVTAAAGAYIDSVSGSGEYDYGSSVTLTATIPTDDNQYHYIFAGWYKNGELVGSDLTYSLLVTGDEEITAMGSALLKTYTMAAEIYQGSEDIIQAVSITNDTREGTIFYYGDQVTARAIVKPNSDLRYLNRIKEWTYYIEGAGWQHWAANPITWTVNMSLTVYAIGETVEASYSYTFDKGSIPDDCAITGLPDAHTKMGLSTFTFPAAPTATNHSVTRSITIYEKLGETTPIQESSQTFETSYTFYKWRGSDGNLYSPGETIDINENLTFTAVWSAGIETAVTPAVTFPERGISGGFRFLYWVVYDRDVNPTNYAELARSGQTRDIPELRGNVYNVYGLWQDITNLHLLVRTDSRTDSVGINGAGYDPDRGYTYGTQISLRCYPKANTIGKEYAFVKWTDSYGQEVSTDNPYAFTIYDDVSLVAVCSETTRKYTISLTKDDLSVDSVTGAGTYDYGSEVTISATMMSDADPNYAYSFTGWYFGDTRVSTSNPYTFTCEGNRTYAATGARIPKIIYCTPWCEAGYGTVSGTDSYERRYYQSGKQETVSVILSQDTMQYHYSFDGWYVNNVLVSSDLTYTFLCTEDIQPEARITRSVKEYNVSIDSSTQQGYFSLISVSHTGMVAYGTKISCTIVAAERTQQYSYRYDKTDILPGFTTTNSTFTFTLNETVLQESSGVYYCTIYPKATRTVNEYTISLMGGGVESYASKLEVLLDGYIPSSRMTVPYGTEVRVRCTLMDNTNVWTYSFVNWISSISGLVAGTTAEMTYTVTNTVTLYAYTAREHTMHTLVFRASTDETHKHVRYITGVEANGVSDPNTVTVHARYGDLVSFKGFVHEDTDQRRFAFNGWYLGDTKTNYDLSNKDILVTRDVELVCDGETQPIGIAHYTYENGEFKKMIPWIYTRGAWRKAGLYVYNPVTGQFDVEF